MFRVARAFTRTDADREDLVQEILLHVWCSLPRFAGQARVSTWLYRVALNTALAWQRKDSRHRASHVPVPAMDALPAADDALRAEQEERVARLYAAIRQLLKVSAALVLMYLDDLRRWGLL